MLEGEASGLHLLSKKEKPFLAEEEEVVPQLFQVMEVVEEEVVQPIQVEEVVVVEVLRKDLVMVEVVVVLHCRIMQEYMIGLRLM